MITHGLLTNLCRTELADSISASEPRAAGASRRDGGSGGEAAYEFACHGAVMNDRKAEEMYCGLIGGGKVKSGLAACPGLVPHRGRDPPPHLPQMSRSVTVTTFHPQPDPHHTSSISAVIM
ncbi:unnamed protein product [Pleuronectes platessa]|uniref:Uncharacterized protein n=1 Tax=Pleuronectes platessa TaxID=8262 RepID=A0A9N7VIE5_PLEPL|nr:unnamed protein product [Pleuronectes platessa]